jgi:hypothetical protein
VLLGVWDARGVDATTRHEEVEAHFRALLEDEGMLAPDDVGYEPGSVVFYWNEPKLAVVIDFEGDTCYTRR